MNPCLPVSGKFTTHIISESGIHKVLPLIIFEFVNSNSIAGKMFWKS